MFSSFLQKRFLITFLVAFSFLYFFRLQSLPTYQIPENREVRLRGRISKQPYLKGSQQNIHLGPILIKTERWPTYFYGQKIEIIGKIEKRVINRFLTQYVANYPIIRAVEEEKSEAKKFNLTTVLFGLRGRVEKAVGELLAEPQASLLLGIVFGVKKAMPKDFQQKLQETGTLHVVVASGQNLTMVTRFLLGFLPWLMSRRKAVVVTPLGVAWYILMAGAEPPLVRAGGMALIAFLAQFLGREEEGTIALLVTAGVMLLVRPLILFDISFQLSFAATAGLIWIYPLLKNKIFSLPFFGPALATTLAAQLAVMPLVGFYFGSLNLWSVLINAVILWVVPLVMALGPIMAVLALAVKPLAQVLSWFVWLLLTYFVKVIETSSRLPGVSLEAGGLSHWWVVGYYGVLAWIIVRTRNRFNQFQDRS